MQMMSPHGIEQIGSIDRMKYILCTLCIREGYRHFAPGEVHCTRKTSHPHIIQQGHNINMIVLTRLQMAQTSKLPSLSNIKVEYAKPKIVSLCHARINIKKYEQLYPVFINVLKPVKMSFD